MTSSPDSPARPGKWAPEHFIILLVGVVLLILLQFTEKNAALRSEQAQLGERGQEQADRKPPMPGTERGSPPPALSADVSPALQQWVDTLTTAANRADSLAYMRGLINTAVGEDRYDYAATYQEKLANLDPDPERIRQAAAFYQKAATGADSTAQGSFSDKARELYQRYVEMNPDDVDAQVELAILKVRSPQPMAGIQQLVSLVEKHPKHFRANLELGKFSLQTGQLHKAEVRFQNAVRANDTRWEGHFFLGLTLSQLGQTEAGRKALETAAEQAPSAQIRQMVQQQLKQL